jgi:hypothetical protein
MAKSSKTTFQKREKEKARQARQREKEAQRLLNKERRANTTPRSAGDEDPDIAGIVPGPQPLPEQWRYAPGEEPETDGNNESV